MQISLPPQIQGFVDTQVASGAFPDEEAVLIAAVENFKKLEAAKTKQYQWLQEQLEMSERDIEAGNFISSEEVKANFERRWGVKYSG